MADRGIGEVKKIHPSSGRGITWDVFECDDGMLQIQKMDEAHEFTSDASAIRHVMDLAEAGDADAIAALLECADSDDLVGVYLK